MSNNQEKAKELASRPYVLVVCRDLTTDEDGYVYIATNPEIEGCKAQGLTMLEAQENLNDVRVNLIEHLIEHGFDIPAPAWQTTTTESDSIEMGEMKRRVNDYFEHPLQSERQGQMFEASLR